MEFINIKTSTADPAAVDMGNLSIQGRVVSKTVQLALFTNNRNSAWAGAQALRRESYPFAQVSFPANRKAFRLEVGDCFLFSWAQYGISNMICRVLQIQEDGPESETITITATEDIYSVVSAITEYIAPTKHSQAPELYPVEPFIYQKAFEAPYYASSDGAARVIALGARRYPYDIGYGVYISIDGGDSYSPIGRAEVLVPHGMLSDAYGITNAIDDAGFLVDIDADADLIESITWATVLSGGNVALLDEEIIFFQNIEPVEGAEYRISGVIRARYGTQRAVHGAAAHIYFLSGGFSIFAHAEIIVGAERKFKFVPYNLKNSASIADCAALDLEIAGVAATPYMPANFCANGGAFAARYDDDVVLAWSPRKRGAGAGIGIPGVVLSDAAHEGLFKIEVYVADVLVRTVAAIDAATWTYTEAMNIEDNGSLAEEIEFRLYNYIGAYVSEPAIVICKKNQGA